MAQSATVKVSNRYQISLPSAARQRLNIEAGDRLLVEVHDGFLILLPQPENYVAHMAGLQLIGRQIQSETRRNKNHSGSNEQKF